VSADLRLAAPAAAAWIALAVALGAPHALPWLALGAWVAAVVLLAVAASLHGRGGRGRRGGRDGRVRRVGSGRPRTARVLVVAAVASAVTALLLTSAVGALPGRSPAALVEASSSGRVVVLQATLTEHVSAGDASFEATVDAVVVGARTSAASAPVRVLGGAPADDLGLGAVVRLRGTVAETEPGDGRAFLVFAESVPDAVGDAPAVVAWAEDPRSAFALAATELPADGGDLLPGLAIGDTSEVGEDLDTAMKTASLSHLTAVSGANCAVVVGIVMVVAGACGAGRGLRAGSAAAALLGFVVLVTPEPSVLRAAAMALIALAAMARGRPARGVAVLALAAALLLTVDPWLARDYGFALSVLATGGLLLVAGPLTDLLARALPRPIAAWIAIPVAAQLACQPLLILLAPSLPTYGVLANVLAAPAAPVATVLGLVACLLTPIAPGPASFVAHVAWVPSAWVAAVARAAAAAPGASVSWVEGAVGAALLAGVVVLVLVVVLRGARLADPAVRLASAALVLAVLVHGSVVVATAVRTAVGRPADWQYAACDVGQGDATLMRSAGSVALVDTGPDASALTGCLDALEVRRLDLLVLTHFDTDHVGGLDAVIGRADLALVGPSDGPEADRLVYALRAGGTEVERVHEGRSGALGDLSWRVLWPPDPLGGILPGNDASVAMRVAPAADCRERCAGVLDAVLLGDLGEEAQSRLIASGRRMDPADVVKVSHHGSADQSERLYDAIDARAALVGVGADNGYGHPAPSALAMLEADGTAVSRTDTDGMVLIASARDGVIRVWSERGG